MRHSKVASLKCNSVEFSATIQIGDSVELHPYTAAVAIQKEGAVFYKEAPLDVPELPNYLQKINVEVNRTNYEPIRVNDININGMTGSSILHIGSFKRGEALSQIKHKRILKEK
ncbi:spore germination protein GerPE [Bacillaceae bacterium W0354]